MNLEQLHQLLSTRKLIDFERTEQDFDHSLRLMLRDTGTGELGILEIRPDAIVLPDELLLNYRYEEVCR